VNKTPGISTRKVSLIRVSGECCEDNSCINNYVFGRLFLKNKQDDVFLDKDRTMDIVKKHNNCILLTAVSLPSAACTGLVTTRIPYESNVLPVVLNNSVVQILTYPSLRYLRIKYSLQEMESRIFTVNFCGQMKIQMRFFLYIINSGSPSTPGPVFVVIIYLDPTYLKTGLKGGITKLSWKTTCPISWSTCHLFVENCTSCRWRSRTFLSRCLQVPESKVSWSVDR
jgi:hypothetical protein